MASVINWRRVLEDNGIPYIERGKNVKKGELNIACPFCGSSDPSQHLGLNQEHGWWACWRNDNHRGRSPVRLLVKLLNVSYFKAREITGLGTDYVDPDGFDAVVSRLKGETSSNRQSVNAVEAFYSHQFFPLWLDCNKYTVQKFHSYLINVRGFDAGDVEELSYSYLLHGCLSEEFTSRLIIPYIHKHTLTQWTGRAIGDASLRYRDGSVEETGTTTSDLLYNFDVGSGYALVVVEGPMDAIKLDFYGRDWGVRSVALSTSSISEDQIYMLEELAPRFNKVLVMRDNKESGFGLVDSMRLKSKLQSIPSCAIIEPPYSYKDAAEVPPKLLTRWARVIAQDYI